jgi:aminopeptidase 2
MVSEFHVQALIFDHSLDVVEDTNSITLNSLEIEVRTATIWSGGNKVDDQPKISYDEEKQRVTFDFTNKLAAGSKACIKIHFTGILNDKMAGFYRSSYKHPNGHTGFIATTQFEATDARRALPCFDEPALKATFKVSLVADKNLTCLSNMDVLEEKAASEPEKKLVTFNTTPLMSTYLLAFIVGELNYIETKSFRVPVRVYSTPDSNIEHGRFALELAANTHFQRWTRSLFLTSMLELWRTGVWSLTDQ